MSALSTPAFLVDEGGLLVFFNEAAGALLGKGFEEVRDFVLIAEDFTQENGMLTPSLKVKRKTATRAVSAGLGKVEPDLFVNLAFDRLFERLAWLDESGQHAIEAAGERAVTGQ